MRAVLPASAKRQTSQFSKPNSPSPVSISQIILTPGTATSLQQVRDEVQQAAAFVVGTLRKALGMWPRDGGGQVLRFDIIRSEALRVAVISPGHAKMKASIQWKLR